MRNLFTLLVLFLTVGGCATVVNPIPDGYVGATATVFDSFVAQDKRKANVFYLESVNGTRIENAEGASRGASAGNGFSLTPQGASRQVPAELLTMHLVGTVQHGADFGALLNLGSNYRVEGDVSFRPEANQSYTVVGQLGENYSAVWLADASGERVSDKVEIKGENFDPAVDGRAQRRVPVVTVGDLSREEVFLRISPGMSVDTVVAKLGAPDVTSVNESGFWSDEPSTVTYGYNELGTVVFLKPNLGIFRKDEAGPTVVLRSNPQIKASDNPDVVRSQIASASGPGLQQLAKNYYAQPAHSIAVLDLFADEIWQNRGVEGGYAVDAMAYLCRTLGKSQNPRYRGVLQQVAEMASSKKLRRYALSSLKLLPTAAVPQYQLLRN